MGLMLHNVLDGMAGTGNRGKAAAPHLISVPELVQTGVQ
jgi:hypothetical protein